MTGAGSSHGSALSLAPMTLRIACRFDLRCLVHAHIGRSGLHCPQVTLVAATGHVVAHLINWGVAAKPTFENFEKQYAGRTWVIWITGFLITFSMFMLFSAASDKVRRAKFKIFWFNHQVPLVCRFLLSAMQCTAGVAP